MKIVLGTTSELKIRATKTALLKLGVDAEVVGLKTDSSVSDQPFGMEEILEGAANRAKKALSEAQADLGIGIENGIIKIDELERWAEVPAVVAVSSDGTKSFSLGVTYPLPDWAVEDIKKNNSELGFIIQKLDPRSEKDPIKYFSADTIKREETLSEAIVCALIEIFHNEKYQKPEDL